MSFGKLNYGYQPLGPYISPQSRGRTAGGEKSPVSPCYDIKEKEPRRDPSGDCFQGGSRDGHSSGSDDHRHPGANRYGYPPYSPYPAYDEYAGWRHQRSRPPPGHLSKLYPFANRTDVTYDHVEAATHNVGNGLTCSFNPECIWDYTQKHKCRGTASGNPEWTLWTWLTLIGIMLGFPIVLPFDPHAWDRVSDRKSELNEMTQEEFSNKLNDMFQRGEYTATPQSQIPPCTLHPGVSCGCPHTKRRGTVLLHFKDFVTIAVLADRERLVVITILSNRDGGPPACWSKLKQQEEIDACLRNESEWRTQPPVRPFPSSPLGTATVVPHHVGTASHGGASPT